MYSKHKTVENFRFNSLQKLRNITKPSKSYNYRKSERKRENKYFSPLQELQPNIKNKQAEMTVFT